MGSGDEPLAPTSVGNVEVVNGGKMAADSYPTKTLRITRSNKGRVVVSVDGAMEFPFSPMEFRLFPGPIEFELFLASKELSEKHADEEVGAFLFVAYCCNSVTDNGESLESEGCWNDVSSENGNGSESAGRRPSDASNEEDAAEELEEKVRGGGRVSIGT